MQNLKNKGLTLRWKNTTTEVVPGGTMIVLPACIAIAVMDIAPDEEQAADITGGFNLPKDSSDIAQGERVYVTADNKVGATAAQDALSAGIAMAAAAAGDANVLVKINV